jgi:hypothetical protein
MIVGGLLVLVWRAISLAAGGAAALEATSSALVAPNWWGTKRLPWRTITQVYAERVSTRYGDHDRLVLLTIDDKVNVPLGCTESVAGGVEGLAHAVDMLRLAALELPAVPEASQAPLASAGAAVRVGGAAAALAVPPQPVRPAFGRKGI